MRFGRRTRSVRLDCVISNSGSQRSCFLLVCFVAAVDQAVKGLGSWPDDWGSSPQHCHDAAVLSLSKALNRQCSRGAVSWLTLCSDPNPNGNLLFLPSQVLDIKLFRNWNLNDPLSLPREMKQGSSLGWVYLQILLFVSLTVVKCLTVQLYILNFFLACIYII